MTHWISTLEVAQVNRGLHYFGLKVPCTVRIIEPFDNGAKIFIHGLPKADAKKLSVDIRTSLAENADVCLHMDILFERNSVIFSTCADGEWNEEEEKALCVASFEPEKPFLLELTASADGYDVAVNNEHLDVVAYRVAASKATHILISGDLRLPGLHFPLGDIIHTNKITIPGNIQKSSVFTMTGRLLPNEDSFSINFQTGESSDSDITLHVNPRYNVGEVVRNCRNGGEWGAEEKDGGFPFDRSQDFSIMIVPRNETYHVWVNGTKFTAFSHRMDMTQACVLNIEGGVRMDDISIDAPPESMPPGSGLEEIIFSSDWKEDKYNPQLPIELDINEAMAGNILCISAVVPPGAERFHINYQAELTENADVVFHYNPRFQSKQVILNTRDGGEWSTDEVRWNDFPFRDGARFEIIIHCSETGFHVSVNDEAPKTFLHRLSLSRAKFIVVKGDIVVKRLIFM
ncbi:galectin-4-like [Centruroides sculpturatus]|uniref:galectin-4-like n=1 Tax=Centruroides sculpturatus TaxID=218467 RepID=UPI000C6DF30A|nr:galectin-4-like [Centruroides sculpturatus]